MQATENGHPKPRVLVVDDSRANLAMLSNLLQNDAQVVTASNGVLALETATTEEFDLILLDVVMPEMDGFEVCRRLKINPDTSEVPVIFVTALNDELDETHGLSLGAVDYITKPYKPAIIKARVANHLLLRQTTQQLKIANTELARLATTDPLTGAFNRRRFIDRAGSEVEKCKISHSPLSALIFDLDRFKRVNDSHGHDIGDAVLIKVVEVCTELLEQSSTLGRFGGEEFAILLPNTTLLSAARVAERLRKAIENIRVPADGGEVGVTMSVGAAELADGTGGVSELLKRADRALYRAKKAGRNRVELDRVDSPENPAETQPVKES